MHWKSGSEAPTVKTRERRASPPRRARLPPRVGGDVRRRCLHVRPALRTAAAASAALARPAREPGGRVACACGLHRDARARAASRRLAVGRVRAHARDGALAACGKRARPAVRGGARLRCAALPARAAGRGAGRDARGRHGLPRGGDPSRVARQLDRALHRRQRARRDDRAAARRRAGRARRLARRARGRRGRQPRVRGAVLAARAATSPRASPSAARSPP